MKYKKGDIVKIRSWEDLEFEKNETPTIIWDMKIFCDQPATLRRKNYTFGRDDVWECDNRYFWRESWFEPIEFLSDEDFEI